MSPWDNVMHCTDQELNDRKLRKNKSWVWPFSMMCIVFELSYKHMMLNEYTLTSNFISRITYNNTG